MKREEDDPPSSTPPPSVAVVLVATLKRDWSVAVRCAVDDATSGFTSTEKVSVWSAPKVSQTVPNTTMEEKPSIATFLCAGNVVINVSF